jgi:hypothetical protein
MGGRLLIKDIFIIKNIMGQRLIITEAEKISIQYRYGMNIVLLEESDKLSKEEMLQKLNNTFDMGPKTKKAVAKVIETNFGNMNGKALLSLILPLLINMTSCQSNGGDECDKDTEIKLSGEMLNKYGKFDTNKDGVLDDFEKQEYGRYAADSIIKSGTQSFYDDERIKSEKESGIDVLGVKFINDNDYSDYKNIKITYKNSTGKDISAISFRWYDLKDVFDEDVEAILSKGGYDDEGLRNGKTTSGTWELKEPKVKSGKVYVDKIMFSDGTKWENDVK